MSRDKQVLFVDDEEGVRRSWQRFLQERGVPTTTAPDGASAIDQLSREPVDVVVSDMRMPGKNGLELLEWLKVRQPETRFIMLTGYGNEGLERRVRELGAVDYLEKPVSPEVLAYAVERALAADRMTPRAAEAVEQRAAVEQAAAVEAVPETAPAARQSPLLTLGMIVAAPLLGLAFVLFLPVIGIAALAWVLAGVVKSALRPAGA
jgi:DNA-binding NtrC family response regulator